MINKYLYNIVKSYLTETYSFQDKEYRSISEIHNHLMKNGCSSICTCDLKYYYMLTYYFPDSVIGLQKLNSSLTRLGNNNNFTIDHIYIINNLDDNEL